MKRLSTTVRITVSLVLITISTLIIASELQLIPNEYGTAMRHRADLCETIAIDCSLHAVRHDTAAMQELVQLIAGRHADIKSLAVRRNDGCILADTGKHVLHWTPATDGLSTDTCMRVPIVDDSTVWGQVEVAFAPLYIDSWWGWCQHPLMHLIAYFSVFGSLCYYVFLCRALRQLNPSRVIPNRVRTALDTLAEGLLILDPQLRITLANLSFVRTVRQRPDSLIGLKVSDLPWSDREFTEGKGALKTPWALALSTGVAQSGELFDYCVNDQERLTFVVNAAPIYDDDGQIRGVLTSLDNVTTLEQKKRELNEIMRQLTESSEEIRRQNQELELLATTDPLTQCLNRRSFFAEFETRWNMATSKALPISCIMVDIDFFKSINDNFGHSVGDDVLKGVAEVLRTVARIDDLVCRFGGEEFCILLPHTDIDDASQVAERLREAIEATRFPQLSVTASLGVSAICFGANTPQEMLDQADKCLYQAKRQGRNRVVRWDSVPDDLIVDESQISRECIGQAIRETEPAESLCSSLS